MTVTERDLELYAARVRAHFEPALRDTAQALAYRFGSPAILASMAMVEWTDRVIAQ